MLVALFRANPQAFIGNNMNRLKAGVVLSVPTAETAQAVAPAEARQIITAQSADFGAYRQRLAGDACRPPSADGRRAPGRAARCRRRSRTASRPPRRRPTS